MCGRIFCKACSSHKAQTAASPKPVRVCDGCYEASSRSAPSVAAVLNPELTRGLEAVLAGGQLLPAAPGPLSPSAGGLGRTSPVPPPIDPPLLAPWARNSTNGYAEAPTSPPSPTGPDPAVLPVAPTGLRFGPKHSPGERTFQDIL